jgi:hypothetical protein
MDDIEREAIRAEGHDPDDPAVPTDSPGTEKCSSSLLIPVVVRPHSICYCFHFLRKGGSTTGSDTTAALHSSRRVHTAERETLF